VRKIKGNQVSTDLLIKSLPTMLFGNEMDQLAKKQLATGAVGMNDPCGQ
jgi:hypothetical protein